MVTNNEQKYSNDEIRDASASFLIHQFRNSDAQNYNELHYVDDGEDFYLRVGRRKDQQPVEKLAEAEADVELLRSALNVAIELLVTAVDDSEHITDDEIGELRDVELSVEKREP